MRAVAAVMLLGVGLTPARALAGWDGYSVQHGSVAFTGPDAVWDPADARTLGTWALRFEALLGPKGSLTSEFGAATACVEDRCEEISIRSTSPAALFDAVARELAVPRARRAAALQVSARPFSVQVAASRDRARAEALATRLSEADLPMGFYEAGGFPADNPEAHVLPARDAQGLTVYRVVVGAFLRRQQAHAHRQQITQATGLPTVLRAL
jgi:hypothetical protein